MVMEGVSRDRGLDRDDRDDWDLEIDCIAALLSHLSSTYSS